MPVWWWLLVTIHLVCGNEETFEDLNENDVNQDTRRENQNEDVTESDLLYIPEAESMRRKRSLFKENIDIRQPKFHSWGGKRNGEDEEDGHREDEISNNIPNNFIRLPKKRSENDEDYINKPTKRMKANPAFSSWGGKRDLEKVDEIEKTPYLYNSILQQVPPKSLSSEQNIKRYPAFNSWAGKRAATFNSWGGKRSAAFNSWGGKRSAAFNSWGGKRVYPFNNWGGKRIAAFNSWAGKRATAFNSWGGKKAAAFNSWGGKRAAAFNSWGGKRATAFNSWGGKRAAAFNSWGGKRATAFNSWGGKRNVFKGVQNNSSYTEDDTFNLSLKNNSYLSDISSNYETVDSEDSGNPSGGKSSEIIDVSNENGNVNEMSRLYNNQFEKFKESKGNENDFTKNQPDDYALKVFQSVDDKYSVLGHHENLNKREKNDYFKMQPRYPGFSSWAGKRSDQVKSVENLIRPMFTTITEKRNPLFINWYGNKIPSVQLSNGKRRPAFSSWGGKKRSEYKGQEDSKCLDCSFPYPIEEGVPELTDFEKTDTSKQSYEEQGALRQKRDIPSVASSSRDKRSNENVKKTPALTKMMLQGGFAWPMILKLPRRSDFYAWGGKRSS